MTMNRSSLRLWATALATAPLILTLISPRLSAKDFAPKTDNRIVALDLETGIMLWKFNPGEMSDAHFEIYDKGLVAYPNYSGDDRSDPMFFDPETGKRIKEFDTGGAVQLINSSETFWSEPEFTLENGWSLSGFSPGNHKTMQFVNGEGEHVWKIETPSYPHQVRHWKNFVFWAYSYLSKEGILYAYHAGEDKPRWTVDLNGIVKGREVPLTRMIFQVIDDVIYLDANEHIFAIEPETGKVLWHKDLAKDLDKPFEGGFFGGGLNLAVFSKSGDTLVVAFEKRVVALDLKTMSYLWQFEPDTFPHCPFPVAHGGRVFLTAGDTATLIGGER